MFKDRLLDEELEEVKKLGFKSKEEFIAESVRTYLAARKDLRIALAVNLYKNEKISLGKAMEISNLNIEELKGELKKKGVGRLTFNTETASEHVLSYVKR